MIDDRSAPTKPSLETHGAYIEARLKDIQSSMVTRSNFGPTLLLANLASYAVIAVVILALNVAGSFG